MSEYRKPYLLLWAGISDAIKELENRNYGIADQILKKAQQDAENAYINSPEEQAGEE